KRIGRVDVKSQANGTPEPGGSSVPKTCAASFAHEVVGGAEGGTLRSGAPEQLGPLHGLGAGASTGCGCCVFALGSVAMRLVLKSAPGCPHRASARPGLNSAATTSRPATRQPRNSRNTEKIISTRQQERLV